MEILPERPDALPGITYKRKVHTADGITLNVYITICDYQGKPFEVFLNCSHAQMMEYMSALMIMVSRLLRSGFDPCVIAEDLKGIHSPFTGHMTGTGYCPSLAASIGEVLLEHSRPLDHASD